MQTRHMPSPDGARNRDNLLRQSQIGAYCTKNTPAIARGGKVPPLSRKNPTGLTRIAEPLPQLL